MTSFFYRIFSSNFQPKRENTVQKEQSTLKNVHKKINEVAGHALKEFSKISSESERFIQSIKNFSEKHALKNERNIMLYILECDFSKGKIKSSDIKVAVKYCIKRAEAGQVSDYERSQICAFFDKLSTLSQEKFDRSALLGQHLSLQKLLSLELGQLLDAQEIDVSLKADTQHQLKISIAKAKLSVQLGFGVSNAGSGVNGAQIIKDLENKPVGVFKARPEIKWYQFSEYLKQYFGQARLLNKNEMSQQFAEVAAHQFDEMMGFKMAPAATMIELKNKEGAFLAFLSGYKELKDCEKTLEARKSYDKGELIKWQMMCLANFLKGNLDPHHQNIFVRLDKDHKLSDIRMIDHGNCFIEYNPGKWGAKGNLGKYGDYKISSYEFEPEVLNFIQNSLTERNLDQFVAEIGKAKEHFWTIRMDQLQRDRLRLLRECVLSGSITNPSALAKVQTQEDYLNYFSRRVPLKTNEDDEIDGFSILDIKH